MNTPNLAGIGMTSQRTRERMIASLPIGFNQTISQPFVVARMTEAVLGNRFADEGKLPNVLEIGTGCGYQTAVIAQLAERVWTVERVRPLLDKARKNMALLNIRNVRSKHDDGSLGWPEYGPFDAIIVAAAPQHVPAELMNQLAEGGRLVIPVGGEQGGQELRLIERRDGEFHTRLLEAVNFVPLYIGQVQH